MTIMFAHYLIAKPSLYIGQTVYQSPSGYNSATSFTITAPPKHNQLELATLPLKSNILTASRHSATYSALPLIVVNDVFPLISSVFHGGGDHQ